ncbi:hypothetical protein FISHEDRAFT_73074 [Fistulina hepatica ATCC 64428]|uniref:Uncharacterized protein n=1 Tax=Fistulina hepatica ATCC 64428 TaxID=1128425 RepID=A0A0D7AF12_9AGAR|nr:hypothetical protein FISHEDRAFT_73074 [Fistulina hepatica ATCC 64428]
MSLHILRPSSEENKGNMCLRARVPNRGKLIPIGNWDLRHGGRVCKQTSKWNGLLPFFRLPTGDYLITAKCTTAAWRRAVAMLKRVPVPTSSARKTVMPPCARAETGAGYESQNLSWGGPPVQGYFLRSCVLFCPDVAFLDEDSYFALNYASHGIEIRDGEVPLSDTMPKHH